MTVDIPDESPKRYKINAEIIVEAFNKGEACDKVMMLLEDVEHDVEKNCFYPDNIFKFTVGKITQTR